MDNSKVVIGTNLSKYAKIADAAERRAIQAESDLTMIKRRIATFYAAITQVRFPVEAPVWAEDWVEWLSTGKVGPLSAVEEGSEAASE